MLIPKNARKCLPCKPVGKRVRLKKVCPVRKCHAVVMSLPRHLRMQHGWSRHDSVTAVNKFALRKRYVYTDDKRYSKAVTVDSHHPRVCPMDGCSAVVKRLPPHIRYHHGIRAESVAKDLLRRARHSKSTFNEHVYDINSEDGVMSEVDDVQDDEFDMTDESTVEDAALTGDDTYGEDEMHPAAANDDEGRDDCDVAHIFATFEQWLVSADGGLKSQKSAKQHRHQAETIVAVTGKHHAPWMFVCKKSLQKKFLDGFAADKKFMPGTTKSYLSSLIHLGNYLMTLEYVSEESKSRTWTMLGCLQRWISAFRKESSERALLRMDSDLRKLITPEVVQKFERSAVA